MHCMGKMHCLQRTPAGREQTAASKNDRRTNPDIHPIITNNVFENLKREGKKSVTHPPARTPCVQQA